MDTARACGDGDNEIGRDVLARAAMSVAASKDSGFIQRMQSSNEHIRSGDLPVRLGHRNLKGISTQRIRNLKV
eukprot:scaffold327275_cov18-Prasinocladus_malaysianus.AAC.2